MDPQWVPTGHEGFQSRPGGGVGEAQRLESVQHDAHAGVELRDGVGVFLDVFSFVNAAWFMHLLWQYPKFDLCLLDDIPWRANLLLLLRTALRIKTSNTPS